MPARRLTLGGLRLLASLTFVSVVVATAATMAIWVYRGARPPEPQGPSAPVVPTRDPGNLLLGGTGAALPLLERLAEAFRQGRGPALCVAPSIGSGGGIRALRDGVIDAAVVSRP
ncbi:MAG: hypothetical protein FJ098_15030, partial [Deltaproteobacteria bacterium]|nr:hypothetical protein [Deltaproteobacteria bacterium]